MEARKLKPIHPGEILFEEFMQPSGSSLPQLASSLGVQDSELDAVLRGQCPITEVLAQALARVWGTSPEFWTNLQRSFDERSNFSNGATMKAG
jgi:antitoxin HigA-1